MNAESDRIANAETSDERGEILAPLNPIDKLAAVLFSEIERDDPAFDCDWDDITEGDKEIYRMYIEVLLVNWDLILKARAELLCQSRRST